MKFKHTLFLLLLISGWVISFIIQPDFSKNKLSIKQIIAFAGGDSENEPPPYPPPGMPQPPPDSIPPYGIPVIYLTK